MCHYPCASGLTSWYTPAASGSEIGFVFATICLALGWVGNVRLIIHDVHRGKLLSLAYLNICISESTCGRGGSVENM